MPISNDKNRVTLNANGFNGNTNKNVILKKLYTVHTSSTLSSVEFSWFSNISTQYGTVGLPILIYFYGIALMSACTRETD